MWPFVGPSSARYTVGLVADLFLSPLTYAPTNVSMGMSGHQEFNNFSLHLREYASLKDVPDPYVIRENYVRGRAHKESPEDIAP